MKRIDVAQLATASVADKVLARHGRVAEKPLSPEDLRELGREALAEFDGLEDNVRSDAGYHTRQAASRFEPERTLRDVIPIGVAGEHARRQKERAEQILDGFAQDQGWTRFDRRRFYELFTRIGEEVEPQGAAPGADSAPRAAKKAAPAKPKLAVVPKEALKEALAELEAMVGLADVKREIKGLSEEIVFDRLRQEAGLKVPVKTRHLAFSGNPGTGKTTVARTLGKIYKALGITKTEEVYEVSRAELVGQYQGHSAAQTKSAFEKARGGILFIDEVYALIQDERDAFGKEAINTLLKLMEDHRDDTIVVVAGYSDLLANFLGSNPGFERRFPTTLHFKDYTSAELTDIFLADLAKRDFVAGDGVKDAVSSHLKSVPRGKNFGNAGFVRNLVDKTTRHTASRVAREGADQKPSVDLLKTVTLGDVMQELPQPSADATDKAMAELERMVGLDEVKRRVKDLAAEVSFDRARAQMGLDVRKKNRHLIFAGNPGTGKTTVARLLGEIYQAQGVIPRSMVVEVARQDLVSDHQGGTAKLVAEKFEQARGGILFVDEVYALLQGDHDAFGQEAIDTLLKLAEDQRDSTIVVVAGYPDKLKKFMDANPGLSRRFPTLIDFEDYSDAQLAQIFTSELAHREYVLAPGAEAEIQKAIAALPRGKNFGNAGAVRNLVDATTDATARRVQRQGGAPTREALTTVTPEDVRAGCAQA